MADTGLYPADQWRSGLNYKAFDWSGYDEDDFPAEVSQQIAAERQRLAKAESPQTTAQKTVQPAAGGSSGSFSNVMSRRNRQTQKPR